MVPIIDRPNQPEGDTGGGPEDPGDPRESRPPPSEDQVLDELSTEILRIHTESYGRGAGSAHATIAGDWVVVVLDDLELLPNEQLLVENGDADTVTRVRAQYQLAIQSSFRAAVERATGRAVEAFASTTSVEPPRFAAEIFKLR